MEKIPCEVDSDCLEYAYAINISKGPGKGYSTAWLFSLCNKTTKTCGRYPASDFARRCTPTDMSNCTSVEMCWRGRCVRAECLFDVDCPEGYVCKNKLCVLNETEVSGESPGEGTERSAGSSCNDTDGGVNYYKKGTCEDDNGTYTDSCDGNYTIEYKCSDRNWCVEERFFCPYGCQDGACKLPEGQSQIGCKLDDGRVTRIGTRINAKLNLDRNKIVLNCGKEETCEDIIAYCGNDLKLHQVKEKGASCIADYECETNTCIDGKCTSVKEEIGTLKKMLETQRIMIYKIWCKLNQLLARKIGDEGDAYYCDCLQKNIGIEKAVEEGCKFPKGGTSSTTTSSSSKTLPS